MPCRIKICQVGKKLDLSWSFVVPITFSYSNLFNIYLGLYINSDLQLINKCYVLDYWL
jgi:hypothetical protein